MAKANFDPKVIKLYTPRLEKLKAMAGKSVSKDIIPFTNAPLTVLSKAGYLSPTVNGKRTVLSKVKNLTVEDLAIGVKAHWKNYETVKRRNLSAANARNAKAAKADVDGVTVPAPKKRKYVRKAVAPGTVPQTPPTVDDRVANSVEKTEASVASIDQRLTNIESILFRLIAEEKVG